MGLWLLVGGWAVGWSSSMRVVLCLKAAAPWRAPFQEMEGGRERESERENDR